MFKKLFGAKDAANTAETQQTAQQSAAAQSTAAGPDQPAAAAFIMFDRADPPRHGPLRAALARRTPSLSTAASDQEPDDAPATSLLAVGPDNAFCPIMIVGAPNPLGENESFINSAWWWPDAKDAVSNRKSHAIINVMGVADPSARYALLANMTAAVIETTPGAIGVIWDAADALWPADTFMSVVNGMDGALPLPLMTSVKVSVDTDFPKPDGGPAWLGMTYGLRQFDMMEIETRGWDDDPQSMIDTLLGLSAYLLEKGPVIGDGDTVDGPATNGRPSKLQIKHQASTLEPGRTVLRLRKLTAH
jgi:hypothetical protein